MASDQKQTPEEQANAQRTVRDGSGTREPGLVETLDKGFESFVNPLVHPEATAEDLNEQREANDAAARDT